MSPKPWTAEQNAAADAWGGAFAESVARRKKRRKPRVLQIDGFALAKLESFVDALPLGGVVVVAQSIPLSRAIENIATRRRGRPEGLKLRAWFICRAVGLDRLREIAEPIRLAPGFSAEAFTGKGDDPAACFAELRALARPELRRAA